MTWGYYPDGKLKSRADDGVPVGKDVVLVDNSDTQSTANTGTWSTGDTTGQQGYDHLTHAVGTGADSFIWTLNSPADGAGRPGSGASPAGGAMRRSPSSLVWRSHAGSTDR